MSCSACFLVFFFFLFFFTELSHSPCIDIPPHVPRRRAIMYVCFFFGSIGALSFFMKLIISSFFYTKRSKRRIFLFLFVCALANAKLPPYLGRRSDYALVTRYLFQITKKTL